MISPAYFTDTLIARNVNFFTGVPDSLLKNICAYITDHIVANRHIIAANEGAAIGLAAGYHLATGYVPVVYMQNSGLGNAVNPLVSLIDRDIYNIPLILLIGWRGEPGIKDEPQHIKQGEITLPLLETMGIKHTVLARSNEEFAMQFEECMQYVHEQKAPYAFVVSKDTFEEYHLLFTEPSPYLMTREEAIQTVTQEMDAADVVVATTGMISRELFEYRDSLQELHQKDFLTVGSMGHASQIALGIALAQPHRRVYCFDGDGAIIMHMGSLAIIGSQKSDNFVHILFNNGAHDSVGGQPTAGFGISIPKIAKACGYETVHSVADKASLKNALLQVKMAQRPALIEIRVSKGARKDIGRPTTTPLQNKEVFMTFLNK